MTATLLALVLSCAGYFLSFTVSASLVQLIAGIFGGLFLLLAVISNLALIGPLQHAEIKVSPRVAELARGDSTLRRYAAFLVFLPIISFVVGAGAIPFEWVSPTELFWGWLILAGISIDVLRTYANRLSNYFNPTAVIRIVAQRGQEDIAASRDSELCDWIAALSEMALIALKRYGFLLAERSITAIAVLLQRFLEVHRRSLQTEAPEANIHQRASFVLFFGFDRLRLIYGHALDDKLEPVCSHIITSLGKISVAAAFGDVTKVSYPLRYITSMALDALEWDLTEVTIKANLTLLEVGKRILGDVDLTKTNVREPFVALVSHLEDIAKASFRRDKESNIRMLVQPLNQLRDAVQGHKLADRDDMKAIVAAIDNVLADFENLQLVLNTIPPIPDLPVVDENLPEIPELVKAAAKVSEKV